MRLYLFDKKESLVQSDTKIEIDLERLETYAHYKHGEEYYDVPSLEVGKKPLLDWFVVDEISYWWFMSPIINPKFKDATRFIDRLYSVKDELKINEIVLKGIHKKSELIKNFCAINKIKFKNESMTPTNVVSNLGKNLVKSVAYKKITKQKTKKRIDCFKASKSLWQPEKGSVIITSPGIYRRTMYDIKNNKTKKEEFFIKPFIDYFEKNDIPFFCVDLDYTFRGNLEALKERLASKINWIPVESIQSSTKTEKTKKIIKVLKNKYKVFKNQDLESVFIYRGVSLWKFLHSTFDEMFLEPNLPTYIDLIYKLKEFLVQIQPRLIIQVYETGPFAKAFEVNAQKLKIKTFGLQHGLIPSDSADYIFKEIEGKEYPHGNVIPNITFVFGEYYKRLLTEKGSYPKNKVVEMGNPSYFEIDEIKKNLKKEFIIKKYNILKANFILVPLSFRFFYYKNNPDKILLDNLYNQFKNDSSYTIIVRPHPGDSFNRESFDKLYPAKNFDFSDRTIVEDLILSDVVVVLPISSVSTEAIFFEKPVILANMISRNIESQFNETYQELIESEVAILAFPDELKEKIHSLKNNADMLEKLSKKRQNFLEKYFHYGKKFDVSKYIFD